MEVEMVQALSKWNELPHNGSVRIGIIPNANISYLFYGTCIPDACSQMDLLTSLVNPFHPEEGPFPLFCHEPDWEPELEEVDGMFICFCSFIAFLMLVGTAAYAYIQYTKKEHLAKGGLAIFLPFAVQLNMKKLFTTNARPAPGTISCLNGMRVMSMCWVIWGHQNFFTVYSLANQSDLYKRLDGFMVQILINAGLSVDTFFFLSGLLVCYGVMREMEKTGRLNIILYYVHRIIRLVPPIAMVTWYFASLNRYAVRGPIPLSYSIPPMMSGQTCQDQWWRDITFTGNVAWDKNQTWGCLGQCWYTAVDMQLYALAPLVLLPLYYFQIGGLIWMFLMTLGALGMRVFITWNMTHISEEEKAETNFWMYDNYYPTWTRADAWLIGAWTGYFIVKMGKMKLQLKQWMVVLGWTVAVAFGLMVQFFYYNNNLPADSAGNIMYDSFHRSIWAACLAWITITCHYGYGGIVNEFLSHPSWQPFSRLTFGMYLFGQELTYTYTYTSRTLFYYTHINKIIETCGILFFSCIYAVLLSLMIEAPILGLEKIFLKRPGRGVDTKPSGSPTNNVVVSSPVAGPVIEKSDSNKGIVNAAYEHSKKGDIPLENLVGKHNEEMTIQLEQNKQKPSPDSHPPPYGFVAPSNTQT